ncbi:MAG: uroporphyrinogen decarboxylase family protein [Candidatus Hermodarchaeota archaeon]
MLARERILKTIEHEEPDHIPSFETSVDNLQVCKYFGEKYFIDEVVKMQKFCFNLCFRNKKILSKFMNFMASKDFGIKKAIEPWIKLYSKIGFDMVTSALCHHPIIFKKDGWIDEFGRKITFKKNPEDNMSLLYYTGGTFKNFDDYQQFPPLDPDNISRERMFKISKRIEANLKGKIFVVPYVNGIMEATWEGFGIETFSKMLPRRREIKQIFDDRGNFALELTKRIIDWGETGAIYISDDYGYKHGLFMSPDNYRTYVIPWIHQISKKAHNADLKVILHSCGDILPIFEDLIKAGIDAFNPIEPTTANPEYNIFKLHKKYGDKITFCGNLSPQLLATGEMSEVELYAKRLIQEIAPGGGYIFSSGHSINPAVKLENFLAMRNILEKFGKYPINMNRLE